jgi:hypothetical protein
MSFLSEQLDRFGRSIRAEDTQQENNGPSVSDVAEMVATAMHLLDRIEARAAKGQPARPGWSEEAARQCVPLFVQWQQHAAKVLEMVRAFAQNGIEIEQANELLHRWNLAKSLATEFERTAVLYRSPPSRGTPLNSIANELQH